MNKTKRFTAQFGWSILALTLLVSGTPVATAGWFDWLNGQEETSSSSGFASGYLAATFRSSTPALVQAETPELKLPLITGTALLANTGPTKNFTKTVTVRELTVPITAYSSTPDQTDDSPFITARGTHVRDGIVAANFLPFGTRLKIPTVFGDKVFVVEDRMNARYWQKIDIWFPDRQGALNFGYRVLKIQILES